MTADKLERIENRARRPNARPIRAMIEQHGSCVLIWLKQTHSAQNAWKAFGHLFRRNAPARVEKASRW